MQSTRYWSSVYISRICAICTCYRLSYEATAAAAEACDIFDFGRYTLPQIMAEYTQVYRKEVFYPRQWRISEIEFASLQRHAGEEPGIPRSGFILSDYKCVWWVHVR